jgi:lysyl-tRNA synthetase, class II
MTDQEIFRRESLEKWRALGVDPYPAEMFDVTNHAADILENYVEEINDDGSKNRLNFQDCRLAGRVVAMRGAGKALFWNLQDSTGRIQLYLNRDTICPEEDKLFFDEGLKKLTDLGDFVGVEGYVFTTKTGETSLHVQKLTFLAKTLRPLPFAKTDAEGTTFSAFSDEELRFRMRYVDLTVNPAIKETFIKRNKIIRAMREYFDAFGWLEVETPILQPIHGGAAARPFATHHNTLDMPFFMRIANELYLKRLIVGGFDGVYEIGKMFRNEGMDRTHNPEFTMMEIYVAYKDYFWMMNMVEQLLESIAIAANGTSEVMIGDQKINFKGPYRRLPILEGIQEFTGIDVTGMDEAGLREVCKKLHIETTPAMGYGKLLDEIFGEKVEPNLIQPTYIIDHPVEISPLAKKHRSKPGFVERFELVVNKKELANAYSELNDPIDQRARFEEQVKLGARGDEEAMPIDEDFLRALEYGMPPTSGLGIGIDRLVMSMTNQATIQEVLFFPQMKAEK